MNTNLRNIDNDIARSAIFADFSHHQTDAQWRALLKEAPMMIVHRATFELRKDSAVERRLSGKVPGGLNIQPEQMLGMYNYYKMGGPFLRYIPSKPTTFQAVKAVYDYVDEVWAINDDITSKCLGSITWVAADIEINGINSNEFLNALMPKQYQHRLMRSYSKELATTMLNALLLRHQYNSYKRGAAAVLYSSHAYMKTMLEAGVIPKDYYLWTARYGPTSYTSLDLAASSNVQELFWQFTDGTHGKQVPGTLSKVDLSVPAKQELLADIGGVLRPPLNQTAQEDPAEGFLLV